MTLQKEDLKNLVDVGFTVADIVLHTGWSISKVRYWLKKYGLQAAREKSSIGHKSWKVVLNREFPAYPIQEEYHIGERLRLDFYIPALYVGFEVDGQQHREKTDFWDFHPDVDQFLERQRLADEKEALCQEKNILLIRINDNLAVKAALEPETCEWLISDIRKRIANHKLPDRGRTQHSPKKYSDYQKRMLEMGREHRKKKYREAIALKKKIEKERDDNAKALSEE